MASTGTQGAAPTVRMRGGSFAVKTPIEHNDQERQGGPIENPQDDQSRHQPGRGIGPPVDAKPNDACDAAAKDEDQNAKNPC